MTLEQFRECSADLLHRLLRIAALEEFRLAGGSFQYQCFSQSILSTCGLTFVGYAPSNDFKTWHVTVCDGRHESYQPPE